MHNVPKIRYNVPMLSPVVNDRFGGNVFAVDSIMLQHFWCIWLHSFATLCNIIELLCISKQHFCRLYCIMVQNYAYHTTIVLRAIMCKNDKKRRKICIIMVKRVDWQRRSQLSLMIFQYIDMHKMKPCACKGTNLQLKDNNIMYAFNNFRIYRT